MTPEDFRWKLREWEEGFAHLGISREGKIRKVREWGTYTRRCRISFSISYLPVLSHLPPFFFPKMCILLCEQMNPFIFLKPKYRVESKALSSPIALHAPPHKLSSMHPFLATQHKHAQFFFFQSPPKSRLSEEEYVSCSLPALDLLFFPMQKHWVLDICEPNKRSNEKVSFALTKPKKITKITAGGIFHFIIIIIIIIVSRYEW